LIRGAFVEFLDNLLFKFLLFTDMVGRVISFYLSRKMGNMLNYPEYTSTANSIRRIK